jgi:predicted S18 family serine protease
MTENDLSKDTLLNMVVQYKNTIEIQSDRIADLEKLLEHSIGSDCREMRYIQEIENKDARIAELEKELQESAMNCISAYAQADDHYARVKELEKQVKHWTTPCQPLCKPSVCDCITPQTKPLSDEEIKAIGKEIWDVGSLSYEDIAFARAIESKVRGEK